LANEEDLRILKNVRYSWLKNILNSYLLNRLLILFVGKVSTWFGQLSTSYEKAKNW